MRRMLFAAILVVLSTVPVLAGEDAAEEIGWVTSFDEALALANKTNHHVVVDVFSPT